MMKGGWSLGSELQEQSLCKTEWFILPTGGSILDAFCNIIHIHEKGTDNNHWCNKIGSCAGCGETIPKYVLLMAEIVREG